MKPFKLIRSIFLEKYPEYHGIEINNNKSYILTKESSIGMPIRYEIIRN